MGKAEFIDLLSSDDEPAKSTSKPYSKAPTSLSPSGPTPRSEPDLFFQSDDFDSIVNLDEGYNVQATKKRKLNSATQTLPAHTNIRIPLADPTFKAAGYDSGRLNDDFAELDDDDPILFTSSAHGDLIAGAVSGTVRKSNKINNQEEDSDCSLPEDLFSAPIQRACAVEKSSSILSEKTRAVLGEISTQRSRSRALPSRGGNEEEEAFAKKDGKRLKKPRDAEQGKAGQASGKEDKEARARERQLAKEQRAKEKEIDALRKREEKEKKAKQKQKDAEIAEVNKAKLDKKDSTPEMIVDLPASLHGQRVDTQTREFLNNLQVDSAVYQSGIPDVIKWRRKVKARWNPDEGRWEPLPRMQIEDEKHIMCILPAADFISLSSAKDDDDDDLDTHVSKLKRAYPDSIPIYLIEGLTRKLRENKTAANRQYQNEVLNADPQTTNLPTSHPPKRRKPPPPIVNEEHIEDALLRLQVQHACLIHHTATHVDTAEWIATFTQHISTIPYKLTRLALTTSTSSCLEPGQVKTGQDVSDTYSKILQEIIRVTPPIAQAIVNEYPSLSALSRAFRKADERGAEMGGGGGSALLERLQKATSRNGGFSDRCVGKAISRRVYGVFMEGDPASTRI